MAVFLIILGALILINGLCLFVFANLNLGTVLTAALGIFLLLWGIYYKKISELTHKGIWKIIKICVIVLILAEAVFVGALAIYGQADNVNYREDAVIVLGAGVRGDRVTLPLKMRLDAAIEYHKKNPEAPIIVTGGKGAQETVTEASAMEKYLIENGVEKDKIIKEEKATSTNENMRFSKQILDEHFGGEYSALVITNNFHIYRSVNIAKREGLKNVSHLHCGLEWYNLIPCYLRESLAVLKMWVFD